MTYLVGPPPRMRRTTMKLLCPVGVTWIPSPGSVASQYVTRLAVGLSEAMYLSVRLRRLESDVVFSTSAIGTSHAGFGGQVRRGVSPPRRTAPRSPGTTRGRYLDPTAIVIH